MSTSFGEGDVTIRFVQTIESDNESNEVECSEDMTRAFQVCQEHSLNPQWIFEKDCFSLKPTKTDVFVFDEFSGSSFEFLKNLPSIIIGPRCILDCLAADIKIPKSKFPLFTLAMRDLLVTTTGFSEPEKTVIAERIQYMGGIYCSEFRQSVTHLVANRICSRKYEKAVENGIPVMTEQWVDAVWEASQKRNVHGIDEEFQKYKCAVFHKLVITASQVVRKQKEILKASINDNGGEFCGELRAGHTNVLIVTKPFGDKYSHAKMWKIPHVTPAWVNDSISAGHALPYANYCLEPREQCSTPENNELPGSLDFSVSVIHYQSSRVNDTKVGEPPRTPIRNNTVISPKTLESPKKNKHLQMIKKIKMSDVKRIGIFLDGCNVYLSGFSPEYTEKLRKIINSGGATRFNDISESVTHVIVGDFVPSDIRILKSQGARLHVVTVEWLIESIRLKSTAPEDKFSCFDDLPSPIEFQSPLSKKGLLALHSENKKHVQTIYTESPKHTLSPKKSLIPKVLFDQYLNANDETTVEEAVVGHAAPNELITNNASLDATLTQISSVNGTQANFFSGITFSIAGYTALQSKEIERHIISAGGKVVSRRFKGIPDYGVVPLHGASLFHTTSEIITHLWLDECAEEGMIVPVKYYHQPVNFVLDAKPLLGCVVTTTSYIGVELRFVTELLEGLGAINQSMMARVDRPCDNLLATTHLVCPSNVDLSSSRKYKASCKWNVPSVTHHWLLACAKQKKRVEEEAFLVFAESHDSSVVIAKTPNSHAKKRKHVDDTSETEHSATNSFPSTSSQGVHAVSMQKQCTPKQVNTTLLRTPQRCDSAANTPEDCSYNTPPSPGYIPTPDTPYGRLFTENPSPGTRKMWKKWIDQWPEEPEFKAPPAKRRNSTPMSELFHKCWQKFAHEPYMKSFHRKNSDTESQIEDVDDEDAPHLPIEKSKQNSRITEISKAGKFASIRYNEDVQTPPSGAGINTQLRELNQILDSASKSSGVERLDTDSDGATPVSSRNVARSPESLDLCTDLVEWVDPVISNQQKLPPVFMLTTIDNREYYEEIIRSLGGVVCSSNLEQTTTHLVCQLPSRNEKVLSSIASGKWVLEKQFLEDSKKEGFFLDEEDYEWGNPKATYLQKYLKPGSLNEQLAKAVYRWRIKIQMSGKKAFAGMKAIVCSSKEKTELFTKIIIAGGGEVLNISPPFSEPGDATICFLDLSKFHHRLDLQALVDKNVPCVLPFYLNDFLTLDPPPDVVSSLIPEYKALQ